MNKKLGNDFETELCKILSENGYWAHNFAQNKSGQPSDIICAKDRRTALIDCKVCSDGKFRLDRMEENQRRAMQVWSECGNGSGWFALELPDQSIYMFMYEFLLFLEQIPKTELDEEHIRLWGIPLEDWLW